MVFGVDDEWLSLIWSVFGLCSASDAVVCSVEDVFDVFPVPTASDEPLCQKVAHVDVVREVGVVLCWVSGNRDLDQSNNS